jgi:hypothetical protein
VPRVTLFAGPSAYGVPRSALFEAGVDLRPPVRRGEIDALLAEATESGVVVICDGVFQSEPAVSHGEILRAVDAGWQVWGVSSIGAIRAFELREEGMNGFGYVRGQFDRFEDFTDDEMCLLHSPQEPYFPLSEALVNVRFVLERWRHALSLSARQERRILETLRALWFGDRTEDTIRHAIVEHGGIDASRVDVLLDWLSQNRIKTIDLLALISSQPWLDNVSPATRSRVRRRPPAPLRP